MTACKVPACPAGLASVAIGGAAIESGNHGLPIFATISVAVCAIGLLPEDL